MAVGQRSETVRRANLSAIVRELHANGPRSRSMLVARIGLTRSAIRSLLGELLAADLVREERAALQGTPGRPSPVVRTNPEAMVVLAVEVNVDSLAAAVVGLGGDVLEIVRVERASGTASVEETITEVVELSRRLLRDPRRRAALVGVGVAVAGVVRRSDGFVSMAPNLGWRDVPFGQRLVPALGLDVHITLPGTMAAMVATMQGAIERKKPIIGFGFVPHWLYGSGVGTFVDFPPYEDACRSDPAWGVTPDLVGDCALPTGDIIELINNDFAKREPNVTDLLKKFVLTNDDVAWGILKQDKGGLTPEAAAAEWISTNEKKWSPWLQ